MNVSEMISYWGYPSETYEVVTEDGYILQLNQIPHGKSETNNLAQKPVMFLQHGLLQTASAWILNLPNNSLGFLLADAGYDVWMGNSRGNTWSRKHVYLHTDSKKFWAFTFDELIKYDLPASVDFVVKKTGQNQIYYVVFSQGTIMGFGGFSTNPQLAEKIKIYFALAPVTTVKYMTSVFRVLGYISPLKFKILFGEKEFLPKAFVSKIIAQNVCNQELLDEVCNNLFSLITGYNPKNLNELDIYITQNIGGTSVLNMIHYRQSIRTGKFQAYDWGSIFQNILHYNQPIPPLYHVENMMVPTAMWSGGRDNLANPIDVKNLVPKISNLIYDKKIPHYSHIDFLSGLDAYT
ncbi:gastric triacylglycerol lipase-like [Orycteropus afer afer]|uniref:Gastric triacylglycerol lipase-like n=1 Tax=Orycteropus afer afer TaxID=1230840 RepID=A0A8B7A2Q8_ORYAF|nr:gastric triacylglycerol lipase-like [Orycteropus afer afer]